MSTKKMQVKVRKINRLSKLTSFKVAGGACLLSMLTAACGTKKSVHVSEVQHAIDQPTRGTAGFMWADATPEQMNTIMGPLMGTKAASFLPKEHVLSERVQYWIDKIDASIRAEHPAKLAKVPKPQARLLKSDVANAYVAPILVCHAVPVRLEGATGTSNIDRVLFNIRAGTLMEYSAHDQQTGVEQGCLEGKDSEATVHALVKEFNAQSLNDACKLSIEGSGSETVLVAGEKCERSPRLKNIKKAGQLVLLQTANFVTVHTGIFELMSEENMISIVAHELGHYYRSHLTATSNEYGYYYTMGRDNVTERPRPEPELKKVGDRAFMASAFLSTVDSLKRVQNQQLRTELYFGIGTLVSHIGNLDDASSECKDAALAINSEDFMEGIRRFPIDGKPSSQQIASYKDFEAQALACLATLEIADGQKVLEADQVSWDVVQAAVGGTFWPEWVFQSQSIASRLGRINKMSAARLRDQPPEVSTNLAKAIKAASERIDQQDRGFGAMLKNAYDLRVGQYTAEQEADDQAAEWTNDVGVDPRAAIDAMKRLGDGQANGLGGLLFGSNDCKKLLDKNWRAPDGSYAFVPVGDYSEVHHSICYRMFNLSREIDAHSYRTPSTGSNQVTLVNAQEWKRLQGVANDESSGLSLQLFELAGVLKNSGFGECVYSYAYRDGAYHEGATAPLSLTRSLAH